uniref:anillin isoform X2 n=1 Tax=Myxine glutinosa TaxID=7769 RepID=UPI00358F56E5
MDTFTQKLLERTRARREVLQKKLAESALAQVADDGQATSVLQNSKRSRMPLSEAVNQEFFAGKDEVDEPSQPKKRVSDDVDSPLMCDENSLPNNLEHASPAVPMNIDSHDGDEQKLELSARSRLQRLADQRRCWDASGDLLEEVDCPSPLAAQQPPASLPNSHVASTNTKSRLASLAATINSWEDEAAHVKRQYKTQSPISSALPKAPRSVSVTPGNGKPPTARTSSDLNERKASPLSQKCDGNSGGGAPTPDSSIVQSLVKKVVSEQFSALETPPKMSKEDKQKHASVPVLTLKRNPEENVTPTCSTKSITTSSGSSVKTFRERFEERCQERTPLSRASPVTRTPGSTPTALLNRFQHVQEETSCASLADKQRKEREKELQLLRGRFQKGSSRVGEKRSARTEVPPASTLPQKEPNGTEVEKSMFSTAQHLIEEPDKLPEKFLVSPSKRVRFAPETECHTICVEPEEDGNNSASCDGIEAEEEENNSNLIDELFDGILDDQPVSEEDNRGSAKDSEESEDCEMVAEDAEDRLESCSMDLSETVEKVENIPQLTLGNCSPKTRSDSCSDLQPAKSCLRRSGSLDNITTLEESALPYSINAYRSQRMSAHARIPANLGSMQSNKAKKPDPSPSHPSLKEMMQVLSNEANVQQSITQQARQALSCCTDEEHGRGSQQEAEAERLLLLSTEKHKALLVELNQLKVGQRKANQAKEPAPACLGCAKVSDIRLPLKADFICSSASKPDKGSCYFVVLLRNGPKNIVATPLISMQAALKTDMVPFPTTFTVQDVPSNFEIHLEVYCLSQKREAAPNEKKKNKGSNITPKKLLSSITKISSSSLPSPASGSSSNLPRQSGFDLVGSAKLTLASVGKAKFQLEQVPFLSPVEGYVYLKFQCRINTAVEECGFLTMFDDVSGFGAWHRRWCVLSGHCISYWTYPDDEKRKDPIGRLNLANCTSERISFTDREFCARPNTLELLTTRPRLRDDCETLIMHIKGQVCISRNWLSADSRFERDMWLDKLNQALLGLRTWQPQGCTSV